MPEIHPFFQHFRDRFHSQRTGRNELSPTGKRSFFCRMFVYGFICTSPTVSFFALTTRPSVYTNGKFTSRTSLHSNFCVFLFLVFDSWFPSCRLCCWQNIVLRSSSILCSFFSVSNPLAKLMIPHLLQVSFHLFLITHTYNNRTPSGHGSNPFQIIYFTTTDLRFN